LKILHIASEAVPFAKTGGLADVAGALPAAQAALGHDVRTVLPCYGSIPLEGFDKLSLLLGVPLGPREEWGSIRQGASPEAGVKVYLLDHVGFFHRPGFYGPPGGEYEDNLERFAFLSRGALQLCRGLDWFPDIVHAHDWQGALVPVYVNTIEKSTPLGSAATVLTIHNMDYQGNFAREKMPYTNLPWARFNTLELEFNGQVSLLKGGLAHADVLTTVSPAYSREIQEQPLGRGLETVLSKRSDAVHGILNGIDYDSWSPSQDRFLPTAYSEQNPVGKARCKAELQRRMALQIRADVPLFGLVTRLAWQKGIDVLADALPKIMELEAQVVMLGAGEPWAESFLEMAKERWPGRVGAFVGYSEELAHLVYAGSDFFVMPSRYEPCGLGQMYALRYGALPVVRATGGLDDTVQSYDEAIGKGTGFKFNDLTVSALADTIGWAMWVYYNRKRDLSNMMKDAMRRRFSWESSAQEYIGLYEEAILGRRAETRTSHGLSKPGQSSGRRGIG